MQTQQKPRRSIGRGRRKGAAAVEFAIVVPLFVLLFLGAVDTGQFANCYKKISDASREGARAAVRNGTSNVATVEAEVREYIELMFPGVPADTLASAVQVTLRDANGSVITGTNLGSAVTGSEIEVDVSLQYDSVRWLSGLQVLGGQNVQAAASMRRE